MKEELPVEFEIGAKEGKSDQERVVMCRSREEKYLEFETARNEAMDKYFKARQGLTRSQTQEDIFGGGFRMAWQLLNARIIELDEESKAKTRY